MPANFTAFMAFRYALGRLGRQGRSPANTTNVNSVGALALAGLVISIAVLVFVTCVVNGFERELRERLLRVLPHITATSEQGIASAVLPEMTNLPEASGLLALAPVVRSSGLLAANGRVVAAQMTGIDKQYWAVSALDQFVDAGRLDELQNAPFGMLMGSRLAAELGLAIGDDVVLLLADQRVSIAGALPRQKRFTLVATFRSQSQLDATGVFVSLAAAQRLLRMPGRVHGVQGRMQDLFDSYAASQYLYQQLAAMAPWVRTWMADFGTLYQAIAVQKATLFLLFSLLIAVAAFNLVSGLIMIVEQRKGDIAILRSMGSSRWAVLRLFSSLGVMLGVAGTVAGIAVGLLLSWIVPSLVNAASQLLLQDFMSQYFIGYLPVQILFEDLLLIAGLAVSTTVLASLYPAWRAMGLQPSQVLANE